MDTQTHGHLMDQISAENPGQQVNTQSGSLVVKTVLNPGCQLLTAACLWGYVNLHQVGLAM